ncbi:MAG: glycosyltransferase family 4 protein [Bacteroidota bacterium]|nr:glycosyltransferase family 4 protein [Bacteroidota bacterium]
MSGKSTMNILFLNSIGKSKFGGGEKWMIKAASGLIKKGHSVWIGGRKDSLFLQNAGKENINTQEISIYSDLQYTKLFSIIKFLKNNHIDILICNLNKDINIAGLAARIAGTPVVLARHGILLATKSWRHKFELKKLADGIITNTHSIKHIYDSYGWFKDDFVKVIYNGVEDFEHDEIMPVPETYRGKKIILSAGRLAYQKGFDFLIKSADILSQKRHDLIFIIAGSGRLEKQLRSQIKLCGLEGSVKLMGYCNDIHKIIHWCDLFVLSSRFEGMPNSILEAMAAGKAIVASDVNGNSELIKDKETGLIVPPNNPLAIAGAIEKLIDRPDLLEQLGQNGRKRVHDYFSLNIMNQKLEEYLLKKLREHKEKINN